MARLGNERKLSAVSRETAENTRNNQSQDTLDPMMAEECITQVFEEIEERFAKKPSKEFSWTESRILVALSRLDDFPLNPQFGTSSFWFREHPGITTLKTGNPVGFVP